jgi:hypothetical protein
MGELLRKSGSMAPSWTGLEWRLAMSGVIINALEAILFVYCKRSQRQRTA